MMALAQEKGGGRVIGSAFNSGALRPDRIKEDLQAIKGNSEKKKVQVIHPEPFVSAQDFKNAFFINLEFF
ncbi:hypothetical protein [Planococcus sp. ISL-110]|uniref:hypothetical protein n=1 Tax=Planococcus sp. ISL-110 TaxID=2819167 RepID=UPI001BE67C34|nr:hypothetical protein [Planococcus sp. ISL-110]MBT2572346.1 hypothetical protein [Planococcus sp. ISL-110]